MGVLYQDYAMNAFGIIDQISGIQYMVMVLNPLDFMRGFGLKKL